MTEHLSVWVGTHLLCSIPMESEKQLEAAKKIHPGLRDGQVFVWVGDKPCR